MNSRRVGVERIFSWSALEEKTRVGILVSVFLLVAISPAIGQSTESGWDIAESSVDSDLNAAAVYGNEIWAFGDGGLMLSSSDEGMTWSTVSSTTTANFISADSAYESMAVLDSTGSVLIKQGQDADWVNIGTPSEGMTDLVLIGEESLILVGDEGAIWKYSASNWLKIETQFTQNLNDVSFLDENNGIACGEDGTILFTDNGGTSWDSRESPLGATSSNLVSVSYYSRVRMFAVSSNGEILASISEGAQNWYLVEIESEGYSTSLNMTLTSIEVVSGSKILFSGPDNYLGFSKDGGNKVEHNLIPEGVDTSFNDHAMINAFKGIVVGDKGVILFTDNSGENDQVGYKIPDYNNFGEFVEYADDMMLDGFKATVKIVGFGIIFGFLIGVILAMLKTAPTNLKGLVEGRPNVIIRIIGGGLIVIGINLFWNGLSGFSELGLDGIEYIFTPVGDSRGFAKFGLGIAFTLLGLLFLSNNGKFSKMKIGRLTLNPWKIRPLNWIATLYTDFFRNTPLIVQFMFIHFGLSLGMEIQDAYESSFGAIGTDGFDYWLLGESAFISAIFTLGLNSGAYQCETIRGAIAAIPSGQMEAGRSIGLTYMGTMKLVIMPQAIRICIPPIGNEMVNLVLNSSLAMVIGYAELSRQGRLIIAWTFQIFWAWGLVMISYFVVTWTLALLLRRLEEKTKIPGLGITGGG